MDADDAALAQACAVEPTGADLLLRRAEALLARHEVALYRAKQLLDGLR